MYHARASKGIVNQAANGKRNTGPFDGFSQRSDVGGVRFATNLPNSNGDGFPRSQLSRLGKELRSRRDTYTKGSYRRNLDRGLQYRKTRNGWQLCPWGTGPW